MEIKKSAIATAIAATFTFSTCVSADIIDMSFTGKFTFIDPSGLPLHNDDADGNSDYGFRTDILGTMTFDTDTGAGSGSIEAFSFYGGGLASTTSVSFQAIGDGMGSVGTLVAGSMNFNWNGTSDIPVTAVFDASGLFNTITTSSPGTPWTVTSGATSTTPDYQLGSFYVGVLGDGPMVMTNYNTAGTTLGDLFPLVDDGIAGSPMTTAPFPGFSIAYDFTSITATTVSPVPVPAAAWLFGSGLLGLVGVARRRR